MIIYLLSSEGSRQLFPREVRHAGSVGREEMRTADLKDARLNARLCEVLSQLGGQPTASIPAACGGHAEMTAAYRLFDNENAPFKRLLEPHVAATRERIARQEVVLLVQDTTEVDLTRPEQQVTGAGRLDGGARRGALLHLLHAFTPDGTPLGTLRAGPWTRGEEVGCAARSRAERAAAPIEEKESYRWVETLRQARAEARGCPATRMICICDSEADIYEYLAEATAEPGGVSWIVRCCQDRAVQTPEGDATAARRLYDCVEARPVLFTQAIRVRGRKAKVACESRGRRQPRRSRQATVEVRTATNVVLRPPWRADRTLPEVAVNGVLVRELVPPAGEEPVEWVLITRLPVADGAQARIVIGYYCGRWMIEVLFRVLKSGCRVEARRFERLDRFESCLAVYLIVAWRTLYVCRLGRGCPEVNCEAVFEPAEWKAAWKVVRRSDPPSQPPSLREMVALVAQLGGYVPRKNSPPGPQTVWLGLQRVHDFALCWNLFGPETREGATLV